MSRPSSLRDRVTVLAFAAFCAVPGVVQLARLARGNPTPGGEVTAELRYRAPLPPWRWSPTLIALYPAAFDAWYRDAFGLRDTLIRWHNRVLYGLFHVSPTDGVVVGEEGWLFFDHHRELESFRGEDRIAPDEREAWRAWLAARQAWFAQRGIASTFAFAPFKSSIYPELVPPRLGPPGQGRLRRFLDELSGASGVSLADLGARIRAAREQTGDLLYFPLGTHWTSRGAYEAYRAIIDELAPRVPGLAAARLEEFSAEPGPGQGDSWAGRMYLDGILEQSWTKLTPNGPRRARLRERERTLSTWVHDDTSLPTGVLIHDSFGGALAPLLAQSFSVLRTSTYDWPVELFEDPPDVVVDIRAEHYLVSKVPDLNPYLDRDELERRFEAGRSLLRLDVTQSSSVEPLGGIDVRAVGAPEPHLVFGYESVFDLCLLPAIEWPREETVALSALVGVSQESSLHVFYVTRADPEFDPRRGFEYELHPGRNEVFLLLSALDIAGGLRLRFGTTAGEAELYALELRALQP